MKFDPTKPYGKITGHEYAQYEQDGRLFDASGDELNPSDRSLNAMIDRGVRMPDSLANAKAFLERILADGPVHKNLIFKVAEENNQPWPEITKAVEVMGIQTMKGQGKGSPILWKMPESLA